MYVKKIKSLFQTQSIVVQYKELIITVKIDYVQHQAVGILHNISFKRNKLSPQHKHN